MAFDVSTITNKGLQLLAEATVSDKFIVDGCDATTTALTLAQAQAVTTRPSSSLSNTTTITDLGSTENIVSCRVYFVAGTNTGGDAKTLYLYGHLQSAPSNIFVLYVASNATFFHLPETGDITNEWEVVFNITYNTDTDAVTIPTQATYASSIDLSNLEERTVTTHKYNDPTQGDNQTIKGKKVFSQVLAGDIDPTTFNDSSKDFYTRHTSSNLSVSLDNIVNMDNTYSMSLEFRKETSSNTKYAYYKKYFWYGVDTYQPTISDKSIKVIDGLYYINNGNIISCNIQEKISSGEPSLSFILNSDTLLNLSTSPSGKSVIFNTDSYKIKAGNDINFYVYDLTTPVFSLEKWQSNNNIEVTLNAYTFTIYSKATYLTTDTILITPSISSTDQTITALVSGKFILDASSSGSSLFLKSDDLSIEGCTVTRGSSTTEVSIGAVIKVWLKTTSGNFASFAGSRLTIASQTYKIAKNNSGTYEAGDHYVPQGIYVYLEDFYCDTTGTAVLMQRVE